MVCYPTLGGSGYGYDVATEYSLELLNRRAGLVPCMFNGPIKEISDRLSGTSLDVEVSCNGRSFLESLLFTHRGISGPSILQISSYWKLGEKISINLAPGFNIFNLLEESKLSNPFNFLLSIGTPRTGNEVIAEIIPGK